MFFGENHTTKISKYTFYLYFSDIDIIKLERKMDMQLGISTAGACKFDNYVYSFGGHFCNEKWEKFNLKTECWEYFRGNHTIRNNTVA
jgi:hypothetical protein